MACINRPINIANITKTPVEGMPDLPFRMIANGGSGQGKTNAIVNFVKWYQDKNLLDRVFIICPTKDQKLMALVEDAEDYFLTPNFKTIQKVIDEIKYVVKDYKKEQKIMEKWNIVKCKNDEELTQDEWNFIDTLETVPPIPKYKHFPRNLVVIDDSIGSQLFGLARQNPLVNFYIRSRHYGCSIILSSQYWASLNKALRANATCFALFKNKDKKQVLSIYEEIGSYMTLEEFMDIFNSATSEKYHFLFMDIEKGVFSKDFNSPYNFSH